jgi:hypothetical protein
MALGVPHGYVRSGCGWDTAMSLFRACRHACIVGGDDSVCSCVLS